MLLIICLSVSSIGIAQTSSSSSKTVSAIAFGSCADMSDDQTIWPAIEKESPDIWVWLGDIVYGDTKNFKKMEAMYAQRKAESGYASLIESCEVIGTWDDHDYGLGDGGKEFSAKAEMQTALLNFLDEAEDSPRRNQEGVYWSHNYGEGERLVKIILLDVRYHKDSPKDPQADILGEKQWKWLERELNESEAAINIIASGIQVIPVDHKYEKWIQYPHAREKLYSTIRKSKASNVIFLSGDRHIAEISKEKPAGLDYPLYDITSSSLTHSWTSNKNEPNRYRVGENFTQNNFGLIQIDWEKRIATASIIDDQNIRQRNVSINIDLKP